MFERYLNEIQFRIRNDYLGKLRFRKGLPRLSTSRITQNEYQYYSLLFKKAFSEDPSIGKQYRHVIDIGCKNWSYLRALADFFPNAELTGIELDGLRRYFNLYRRIDYAHAQAHAIRESGRVVEVKLGDFREVSFSGLKSPVLFCFLFPFVTEYPCLRWGLPSQFANFSSLIQHSKVLTNVSGSHTGWLSVHQGEWEAKVAKKVYQENEIDVVEKILIPAEWSGLWPAVEAASIYCSQPPVFKKK
jgi:hypothetical protein